MTSHRVTYNGGGRSSAENVRYARDLDEALSVLKSGKTRRIS